MKLWQIGLAGFIVIVSLTGQAIIKKGLNQVSGASAPGGLWNLLFATLINPFVFGGLVLMTVSAISYLFLLKYTDFTRALPVMGAIVYILVPIYGYFFLREDISARQLAGLGLLLTAIFLMRK